MTKRDRSDRQRAMGQLGADDPSAENPSTGDPTTGGPTIVGGQPPSGQFLRRVSVPVGVEKVLYLAAAEPAFRDALLADREIAVRERGVTLRDSEMAMLRLAPEAQLAAAIDQLDISETNLGRRRFMRGVATAAVTLAGGKVLGGCEINGAGGARPDDATVGDDIPARMDSGGARPDYDAHVGDDIPAVMDAGGARPDADYLDHDEYPEASPAGIRPDAPEDLDVDLAGDSAGIRPDGGSDAYVAYDVPQVVDAGGSRPDLDGGEDD